MGGILEKLQEAKTPEQKYSLFAFELMRLSRRERIPINVYFEITPLCNFQCKMCYSRLSLEEANEKGGLIPAEKWIDWAKQCAELGTMDLIFTGGECTSHPQFKEIYKAVSEMGFRVTLMTNASLIESELFELFGSYPPARVSITLYGFSSETYERTTGNAAAFDRVIRNIEKLFDMGIPITLKSTVTKEMLSDFTTIYDYARLKGVQFIYSNALMSNREAHNRDCDSIAVDSKTISRLFDEYYGRKQIKYQEAPLLTDAELEKMPIFEKGMQCGAGRNGFTINWKGGMQACTTSEEHSIDLNNCSVADAWARTVEYADNIPQIIECQKCKYARRCRKCVFSHYADTGVYGKPSPRLCYKILNNIKD